MDVYLVYVESDTTEGKGPMVLKHIFAEEEHAVKWVTAQPDPWGQTTRVPAYRKNGVYRFGHMEIRPTGVITEDISELEARRAALRETTLASLTSEQKWALGLDDTEPT